MVRRFWIALAFLGVIGALPLAFASDGPGQVLVLEAAQVPERLYVVRGTKVVFQGSLAPAPVAERVALLRGSIEKDAGQFRKTWTLGFDTNGDTASFARLSVVHTKANGETELLARTTVEYVPSVPFRIAEPADGAASSSVLRVRIEAAGSLRMASASLKLDGKRAVPIASDGAGTVDCSTLDPGAHTLSGWVTASAGGVFVLEPVKFTAKPVVEVLPPQGGKIEVPSEHEVAELRATIAPGLTVQKINYLVDGWPVASRTAAPYDRVEWDVERIPPGPHILQVEVFDAEGKRHASAPCPVTLVKGGVSVPPVKVSELPVLGHPDISRLRRYAQTLSAVVPPQRGAPGTAHGLVVNTVRARGIVLAEAGEPLVVNVSAAPGTGKATLKASADMYLEAAWKNAIAYCKAKAQAMGLQVDWDHLDVSVSFGRVEALGGDSAGAAMATALLSRITGLPVDISVAMTGTVSPEGAVGPVGGIAFKSVAAFKDGTVSTLIVPSTADAVRDLDTLFRLDPDLFTQVRVVLADNMEQVLQYALIGYDADRVAKADELYRNGLVQFGRGNRDAALRNLRMASDLAPENLTIRVWIAAIRQAE